MRQISSQIHHRKGKKMATDKNPEMGKKKEEAMDFEFIDESEIESVKRGRKAQVIPEMLEVFTKTKVGQVVKVVRFALGEEILSDSDKKTAKAKNSATIRSHAKAAGWKKVQIWWSPKGVPQVKRIA